MTGRSDVQLGLDIKRCEFCGCEFHRSSKEHPPRWKRRRHCSVECARGHTRRVARVIAGEFRIHSKGYRMLFCPFHPSETKGYVYEHRVIAERTLGRLLGSSEHVHHINGDKADNRPENLLVTDGRWHRIEHGGGPHDEEVARLIRRGLTSRQIAALGASTHRIVRVRREMTR